ncbi:hypothetical protein VRU48_01565 [Pedobacter sp. KR3-3]|uniref:Uncharacterized protein n=1 Tax=Pedobacter albus TaxID=3113905 RepID=A0ABU7I307_9SPHI|nr:hypothetical protein [Pedobacter sp. KR3-3]MEE1943774.1 hypothetical protein [Pedobacter sp. KR3-3]
MTTKLLAICLAMLLFTVPVFAAVPVDGQACLNHLTGDIFQTRTAAPPISGRYTYANSDPIVQSGSLCFTYVTVGRCYIEGVPGPLSGATWNAVTITVYDCPLDDYAIPFLIAISVSTFFMLKRQKATLA